MLSGIANEINTRLFIFTSMIISNLIIRLYVYMLCHFLSLPYATPDFENKIIKDRFITTGISCGQPDEYDYLQTLTVPYEETLFESWVNYTCHPGFEYPEVISNISSRCNANGNWSYVEDWCISKLIQLIL